MAQKRKLQAFVSPTYEDLKPPVKPCLKQF